MSGTAGRPLDRIGTPHDVAAATALQLSRDSSRTAGRALVPDGGPGPTGPL